LARKEIRRVAESTRGEMLVTWRRRAFDDDCRALRDPVGAGDAHVQIVAPLTPTAGRDQRADHERDRDDDQQSDVEILACFAHAVSGSSIPARVSR